MKGFVYVMGRRLWALTGLLVGRGPFKTDRNGRMYLSTAGLQSEECVGRSEGSKSKK